MQHCLANACLLSPLLAAALAHAQDSPVTPPQALRPVVVSATRTEAQALDVPASVDRVDGADMRLGRAQVNISEGLAAVPGLQARERQNYAQDVQVSVRGFGARASFGIRGVRLYVDGIPATLPDGQGQISHVDLASAERIEVLRGPFSALYGNSSGGVLQVFTEEGRGAPRLTFSTAAGSDGLLRYGLKASGNSGANDGGVGYVLSASRFSTDGYRDHSETRRSIGNAKLTLRPHEDGKLTLVANRVVLPLAQDPLGLARAQFEANPRGVDPGAINFDTRKTMDQTQAGLVYEHFVSDAHALQATLYGGQRGTTQFQAIPVAVQANALHPGGMIDLQRDYAGGDLRWTWRTELAAAPLTVVAGLAYDGLREDRRGYQNFVGGPANRVLGVQGSLRRDERNRVTSFDQYLQAEWKPTARWNLNAGLRHSRIRFASEDRYIVGPNPNDSGAARYGATLPVLGASFAVVDDLRVYAAAGKGFETPTLNELSYRPNGQTGLNFALNPARSTSVEFGLKSRSAAWGDWTAAVFRTNTEDEITTLSSVGGRATFQNAGSTRRNGLELAWSQAVWRDLRARLAYTALDARYAAGTRIPGLARNTVYASATWQPPQGWRGGLEWRALSRVAVNDGNTDAAAGHAVAAAFVGYATRIGVWDLEGFVRADNLLDKRYIGSVIVNEGNGRFFEPAPGRTWLAGVSASIRF